VTILERIAEIEKRLLKQMPEGTPEQDAAAEEAIHRFAMLVAQMGYAHAVNEETGCRLIADAFGESTRAQAGRAFPLPPKRVLREEWDTSDGGDVKWRFAPSGMQYQECGQGPWLFPQHTNRDFAPYVARVNLWHSLMHNPYREVPDNGDE
jgi:hypothetical protein